MNSQDLEKSLGPFDPLFSYLTLVRIHHPDSVAMGQLPWGHVEPQQAKLLFAGRPLGPPPFWGLSQVRVTAPAEEFCRAELGAQTHPTGLNKLEGFSEI